MHILGVTGGVASGKSAATAEFKRLGAVAFDADRVGHKALERSSVGAALIIRWGRDVLDASGQINRAWIADRVFADTPEGRKDRQYLEHLVHPLIRHELSKSIAAVRDTASVAVVDAALLLETGWNDLCTSVAFVDAPHELRLRRAMQRGWSEADFARREAAQMPIETKRSRCDWVVDNSGSLAEMAADVARVWREIAG